MSDAPVQAAKPFADDLKRAAAARALEEVRDGQRLGLGTGSTAAHFVDLLGARVRHGLNVLCVPTSEATRAQAERLAIPLSTLDETPRLDLTIDGTDEFDPALRLIKGGGGALLREKIVAAASSRMIVITDVSKEVAILGKFPLPVEVDRFGLASTHRNIEDAAQALGLSGTITSRQSPAGHAFVTDGGHVILDCAFGAIGAPDALAARLKTIPGVVEHGLFIGFAHRIIIADTAGTRIIDRQS